MYGSPPAHWAVMLAFGMTVGLIPQLPMIVAVDP